MPTHPARAPRRRALTRALWLSLAAPASAFAVDAAVDPTPQQLDVVRVIGKIEDPQSSMGSAYVLSERELHKFGSSNANDVLGTVPGVYTREESGLGQFPRIGIRASSAGRSDRISVLEDGIPAAMAAYANTSAYFFPNIGRMRMVEVLKGPEILFHGPQTTSGVVNLVSSAIPQQFGGMLNAEFGSFDRHKIHANVGGSQGQWSWLLETYQAASDGFHQIDRSRNGAGFRINDWMGKLRWQSAPDAAYPQQLDIKLGYDRESLDVSYLGLTEADFRADPNRRYGLSALERMNRGRKNASVQHQIWFGADTRLTSTLYGADTHRYYNRLNQINGINLGGITSIINTGGADADLLQGILDGTRDTTHANGVRYGHNHQAFTSKGAQIELNHGFASGEAWHELTGGVRWHHDTTRNAVNGIANSFYQQIDGTLVYQSTASATPSRGEARALAFWLGDRITIGQWNLLPMLRHERIRSQANLARDATAEQIAARKHNRLDKTTLGFGANYALNPNWTLLGGIHQGFAPPGNGVAHGTRGEESINYEGGLRWRSGTWGVDAIGFHTDYRNSMRTCMVANPCPGGRVDGTEQTGRKRVSGLELGAFGVLHETDSLRVPLRLAWTFTDGEYTRASDSGAVLKGDVIEYTPKTVGTLRLGLETSAGWNSYLALNWQAKAWTSNVARRPGVDNRLLQTQSLMTVDLASHYPLAANTELYVRVNNVFDQQRITHRGADGARGNAPREFSIGMRTTF
ncbi:TonB-dependent receptor family protein [Luteimonas sp. e5]